MKKSTVFLSVFLLCASAIVCALILVKPSVLFRNAGDVRVKGAAAARVMSDVASWRTDVSAAAETEAEAFARLKVAQATVRAFLKERGVEEKDIADTLLTWVNFKKENGENTNTVEAYGYTWSITLKTNDFDFLDRLMREAPALVEKGVSLKVFTPDYFYTKLESLKLELLEKASANARERARLLISGSGSKLGKVVSASQGVFQITAPLSTETSDYGMYDTSSREKRVQCVVTVAFEVEK